MISLQYRVQLLQQRIKRLNIFLNSVVFWMYRWFSFPGDSRDWESWAGRSCCQLPDLRASQLGDTSGRPGASPGALLMTYSACSVSAAAINNNPAAPNQHLRDAAHMKPKHVEWTLRHADSDSGSLLSGLWQILIYHHLMYKIWHIQYSSFVLVLVELTCLHSLI